MQCLSSTYNIASASVFYPSRPQKQSAKPSAFYTFENPQVRRSANPHFTGGLCEVVCSENCSVDIALVKFESSMYARGYQSTRHTVISSRSQLVTSQLDGLWSKRRQTKSAKVRHDGQLVKRFYNVTSWLVSTPGNSLGLVALFADHGDEHAYNANASGLQYQCNGCCYNFIWSNSMH